MSTRVALVTGASRGIGEAIARRLAADGFTVIVNYRSSAEQAEVVVREIRERGGTGDAMQADVGDLAQASALVDQIRARYQRLDVLVNNAGRSEDGLLLLVPHERWWSLFNDNVAAVVNCTRAALPMLWTQKGSAIVNISSVSGLRGVAGLSAYCAAKAAVIGFTRSLAAEVGRKGISVNCVAPGPIDTEMYRTVPEDKQKARLATLPLGRVGQADEVAEVVSMLASGRSRFVHGQVIAVDGGATL